MAESTYQGAIGEQIIRQMTITKIFSFPSAFGKYNINVMVDKDSNVFVWKTGKSVEKWKGVCVWIKGTVKEHSEYNGIKQTILTRCTYAEVEIK